uniref:Lon proteolytic domain-containing protein n=1 Tax=viral metagenome TaxID=1070528 RepID=A0A6C0ASG3_9ZZZZ
MSEKYGATKKNIIPKNNQDMLLLIEKKIEFFKDIIQKTIIHVQENKFLDILGISDVSHCVETLGELSKKIEELFNNKQNTEDVINNLQLINNELSGILKNYGTHNLEDLIHICFGNSNVFSDNIDNSKYILLKKYFHPTGYKVLNKKDEIKFKKSDEIDENTSNLSCYDIASSHKKFHIKVYGIKIYIFSTTLKKSLIIYGTLDDIVIDFLKNSFILNKQKLIKDNLPKEDHFQTNTFNNFISSLTLKDYLICNNHDIYCKYVGYINQNTLLKQKQVSHTIKEFISDDMYNKRNTLINLLIFSSNYENQYLAYLLYDILSNDTNGNVDTQEQTILFDSFPWPIKQYFKHAMKKTIQYTNELSNFDINKIPLEQQICLLKASDSVKEKAMMKLKEVKAKSEDSGSKARQYLDGLLKIPFNIYKKEPILNVMDKIRNKFKDIYKKHGTEKLFKNIPNKEKYASIEILKYVKLLEEDTIDTSNNTQNIEITNTIKEFLIKGDKKNLLDNITTLSIIINDQNNDNKDKTYKKMTKQQLKSEIESLLEIEDTNIIQNIIHKYNYIINKNSQNNSILHIKSELDVIHSDMKQITGYMSNIKTTLDKAVYGHDKAKKQIERIIGQWINGEQDGYCFGFEGPPGVGKTTLAKRGLSDCLKDDNDVSRPFSMIQMGGDSNGSTLHGHNYTYVGSTWGSIVQILIDKKCMNPIIFIDEVDKISRTEHGKEIVGILTHLLDPAQNDCFQDKYFTGIDLDLSKALFILSYNDVEAIDKILLDRIHRIKFSNLSLEDKVIICNNHIIPEVYKKMGLENMITINEDVIKFIIDEYTSESGVRKLKEILFEIVGQINLDVLNNLSNYNIPIEITIDDIKNKYFKDKHEIRIKKIHSESKIGIINGLWANSYGKGGVIPIQVNWRPSDKFLDLNLTGMQGDVMKESMNVALTLAWNLTNNNIKKELREKYDTSNNINGIHIHCPEGSIPKDGPSAGTAITTAIYSILNNIKIKYNIAITGEISFDGFVTEIGGLDLKILGSIKAGVKEILFPVENIKDYNNFMEKYKDNELIKNIKFYPVNTISEVFELVFDQ